MADNKVPQIEDLLIPIVRVLKRLGGTADISDIEPRVEIELSLSPEVLKLPHPNDSRTELSYRQAWARTRLKNAEFLRNPSRSLWSLTEDAQKLSDDNIELLPRLVSERLKEDRNQPSRVRLKRLGKRTPKAPSQRHGPKFHVTSQGFEIIADLPSSSEGKDPIQIALHKQILNKINTLKLMVSRIANTHPTLLSEFNKYTTLVSPEIEQIDIVSAWSVGGALHGILEALRHPSPDSMTEALEPEILGELTTLVALHGAFLLGFQVGRELASRAQAFANTNRNIAETAKETSSILQPMLLSTGLLAKRARQIIDTLNSSIETANYRTALLVQSSVDTATNSLIAYGQALLAIATTTSGGLELYSDPNWEPVRAAIRFLIENRGAIGIFAAHNPELKNWLDWTIERAQAFKDKQKSNHA